MHEMARLMISLGAVDAMNLDGGSSTQMVVQGRLVSSLRLHVTCPDDVAMPALMLGSPMKNARL